MRRTPTLCPSCDGPLAVAELRCPRCATTIHGDFSTTGCRFCALPAEQKNLLDLFLRCRGNMRDVERALGLSYPTVRARVDALLATLGYTNTPQADQSDQRREILEALNDGSLTADEAVGLLEALP